MEIKNYNEFFALVTLLQGYFEVIKYNFLCQEKGYFNRKTCVWCPFSVILVNLNVRL